MTTFSKPIIAAMILVPVIGVAGIVAVGQLRHDPASHPAGSAEMGHGNHAMMAENLARTAIPWAVGAPLEVAALTGTNEQPMAQQLQGKWSLLFFGFTSCPHVCPTTLNALAGAAGHAGGSIASDDAQVLFVTVDPDNDSPERITQYLSGFDQRFIGYTGSDEALSSFSTAVGAAFEATENGFDHSTSVFVIDPMGRPAGVLLRPTDPMRLIRDFDHIKRSAAEAALHAGRHDTKAAEQHADHHAGSV